ncbi:non-canonical purine NTP pyrophosphatase, rdgB/HAM1 family [Thermobaculum terrenum ATCC BAA-798]|uniref:dITP/XTP pyrophosphatase n=1 Tax=Thermobaculum terrenum (strain ATCC BAA-798 / CCMEE 7001 / YNP1) TaxID=525904 RepID=D1CD51_THET1|nr:non-canonical purine NTP pyrophosphatase, rdgB/HAM1 family [Thermobaculum terrenum ATCC BAA-798]
MKLSKLLIASDNPGKLAEYQELLSGLGIEIVSMRDAGIERAPEETGSTFEENALIKARYCWNMTGISSIADDSGLEVAALGGEPGVRSKRWAGEQISDAERNKLLIERLNKASSSNKSARFVCVIALIDRYGNEHLFRGEVEGVIIDHPRGSHGFGYDPIFYLPELGKTFAELDMLEKNRVSHRARAAQLAVDWIKRNLDKL